MHTVHIEILFMLADLEGESKRACIWQGTMKISQKEVRFLRYPRIRKNRK